MARSTPYAVGLHLDRETYHEIARVAQEMGILNNRGDPNMSAAAELLIGVALREGSEDLEIARLAYIAARSELVVAFRDRFYQFLKDLAEVDTGMPE